jgi:hypothetical protein
MVIEFCTQNQFVPAAIDNILPGAQLEDKLLAYCDQQGLSRHDHQDLKHLLQMCGVKDDYRTDATIAQIQAHLNTGNPCISAGYYTDYGHIVVIGGYTPRGFILFDPYGEWFPDGYRRNFGDNQYGNGYLLSYATWKRLNVDTEGAWIHFCSPAAK